MVTGENQQVVRVIGVDKVDVLGDRVSGSPVHIEAGVRLFTGRKHEYAAVPGIETPASARGDIAVQQNGFVLGQNTYDIDPAVGTVAERKINDTVFAAVGNGRFSDFVRKVVKTAPPASGKNHR